MSASQYAPIIIFAFNRLEPLKATVASVLRNTEAAESDLYVFVDGARPNKEGEKEKVQAVQEFVKTISGFKSVHYTFVDHNKGLGPSIIAGVSEVINQYGRTIVLEDDLVVQPNFLAFMNQGLVRYCDNKKVWSICGHTCKVKPPKDYLSDCYFGVRSASWGWASWVDRWQSVDWELKDWETVEKNHHKFNKWGGSDLYGMLLSWKIGRNKSWAVRFCYNQFIQNKLALFPIKSLVADNGHDGSGTNCKSWSRFKYELEPTGKKDFIWPISISINRSLYKEAYKYHTIWIRIYSKIMYLIHGNQ